MLIDSERLRANVEASAVRLAADPEAGLVRPRVSTSLVEDVHAVSRFVQYDKEFVFECDESEGRAGRGEHPSPLRYFLSGLAFCQQVWYAKGAAIAGCTLESLDIDVSTYMDMRGEHHVGDVPTHPQWILVEAAVTSPSPQVAVLAMVDEANARCPIYGLVSRAVPIHERIVHNGTLIRDTAPPGLS